MFKLQDDVTKQMLEDLKIALEKFLKENQENGTPAYDYINRIDDL